MTRDELEVVLKELPAGEVRVSLTDPKGTEYLRHARVSRPTLVVEPPYEGYFEEFDNRPSVWITAKNGSGMYSAWPVDTASFDKYQRLVVTGPKGRAVYVVQS